MTSGKASQWHAAYTQWHSRVIVLAMRGHLWIIRRFGVRRWWRYRQARRAGVTVDYAKTFTPEELARLGEHFVPAPWEPPAKAPPPPPPTPGIGLGEIGPRPK